MPKLSGESLKVTRAPPRPQPSPRKIMTFASQAGPKTLPNAQGAPKRFDNLKPSPGGGIMPKQQVY
jgi:hypothetical protein